MDGIQETISMAFAVAAADCDAALLGALYYLVLKMCHKRFAGTNLYLPVPAEEIPLKGTCLKHSAVVEASHGAVFENDIDAELKSSSICWFEFLHRYEKGWLSELVDDEAKLPTGKAIGSSPVTLRLSGYSFVEDSRPFDRAICAIFLSSSLPLPDAVV